MSDGVDVRTLWGLDFSRLHVNHGSFGAAPLSVLAEQQLWRDRMEAGTTYFMADVLPGALRDSAAVLADHAGARAEDLVFVENATSGVNVVLRSLDFAPGDEILLHSHIYGAVLKTARYVAERTGARIVTAELPFPGTTNAGIVAAFAAALSPRTKIAVIDHIVSPSALIFPVAEIVAVCRAAGALVLVDGAHAPGSVPLDLAALDADYYTGNCHKWLMAPKGAAFLWTRKDRQAGLHPAMISHGYGTGFAEEFDWTGTRDWSAALAVPAAIAFHTAMDGERLMQANHDLAWEAAEMLSARWATPIAAVEEMFAAMTLVKSPVAGDVETLRTRLRAAGADAPVFEIGGELWLRLSAQAYNRIDDYARLGDLIDAL